MAATTQKPLETDRQSLEAGDRLLKAIKDKMVERGETVDEATLRQQGYSEDTIARLKEL